MEYEIMYLISEKDTARLAEIKAEIDAIVATAGAVKKGTEIDFTQKLKYEIKHNWTGIYVASRFTLEDKDTRDEAGTGDAVAEISRQINLHKSVLRYIVVSAEYLPTLEEFQQTRLKSASEGKTSLKEKGEKIDGKLEKVLKI